MNGSLLAWAAALLGIERVAYAVIWRNPLAFRRWALRSLFSTLGGPVDALMLLCLIFKLIQLGVFLSWIATYGGGRLWPYSPEWRIASVGIVLVATGQALNLLVFRRLGTVGVFYGNRFGHDIPWCRRFPFTWFAHPQYVGTVVAIWGFFVLMRYPAPDWPILPLLETAYYAAGAHFERERT